MIQSTNFIANLASFNSKLINKETIAPNNINFSDILREKLDEVNKQQINSDKITESFLNGDENVDIHDVMLAAEEARISLELAIQVRNKVLEAVQELNRMQI